jgi:hypothetical protein
VRPVLARVRQDGREYIVTDGHIMAQFEEAPQREVNRRREVNRYQTDVNRLRDGVNSHRAAMASRTP